MDARAKSIFDQAIDLSGAARRAYLDNACADPVLRARVEVLLNGAETDDDFLRDPSLDAAQDASDSFELRPGTRIGAYELVELIGEGGFGSVYLAKQEQPVRRRVALKIIKLGMDTRAVVARFEQERQALALFDHPNIAKVFDAGATPTGRPYFVMELVQGEPITDYCDRHSLTIEDRLALFTQVCSAVQHAHTKGVIHRDLKPSNVLVCEPDSIADFGLRIAGSKPGTNPQSAIHNPQSPLVKVIDFGIAKAVDRPLTEKTIFTEQRGPIGTPEYMSPEQAEGSRDLDTRTDVYSLGVVLYELLAGLPPFDPHQLRSAGYAEVQRIIREVDPPKPSTRVAHARTTPELKLASVAAQRATDPARLNSALRGELDWIIMRALEKDRARRYESPGALASDLTRYLRNEAVMAAPPSRVYAARKFVRRNRLAVTAATAVLASLATGLGVALWQARVARQERDIAQQRGKDLKAVADFQASQLKNIDAQRMGQTMREDLLANAKAGMERAKLPPDQIDQRQKQLADLLGDANLTNVALSALDKNVFERAIKAVHEQFKDQPLIQSGLLLTLAQTLTELALFDRSQPLIAESLEIRRRLLGDDDPETITVIGDMGFQMRSLGKYGEAEPYYREAFERSQRVQPNDMMTFDCMNNLAMILQLEGKLGDAEPLYRKALERQRALVGEDNPDTIRSLSNVGFVLQAQGKIAESAPYFTQALERERRVKGDDDPETLTMMNNTASILQMSGKSAEAEPLFVLVLQKRRTLFGDTHADTLRSLHNLGVVYQSEGKLDKAEACFREALESRRQTLKPRHPFLLQSESALGALLMTKEQYAQAEPLLRDAMEGRREVLGAGAAETLNSTKDLGVLMVRQHKAADGLALLTTAVEGLDQKIGKNRWQTADARLGLGEALHALARYPEAESALTDAYAVLTTAQGAPLDRPGQCARELVDLYEDWNKAEPGKGYDAKAKAWKDKVPLNK